MANNKIKNNSNRIIISQKLYNKIYDYCSLNEFTNEETNKFIEDCLEKGFMIELYGIKPQISKTQVQEAKNTIVIEQNNPNERKIETTIIETVKEQEEQKVHDINELNTKDVNLEIIEDKPKTKRRKLT